MLFEAPLVEHSSIEFFTPRVTPLESVFVHALVFPDWKSSLNTIDAGFGVGKGLGVGIGLDVGV